MPNPETDIVQSRIAVPGPNGGTVTAGDFSGVLARLDALEALVNPPSEALLAGRYFGPLSRLSGYETPTALTLNANRLYATVLYVAQPATFNQAGIEVTTAIAGATIRLGVYQANTNGTPNALVADLGTIDASTTGFRPTPAISLTLARGLYWLSGAPSAAVAVKALNSLTGTTAVIGHDGTSGTQPRSAFFRSTLLTSGFTSLPDPFGGVTTTYWIPVFWVRSN